MVAMKAYTEQAFRLLMEGAQALVEVEATGIRIDTDYLDKQIDRNRKRIRHYEAKLTGSEVYRVWRKTYGSKMNLQSGPQLAVVLFDKMGYESAGLTLGEVHRTDEESLSKVDDPFVKDYMHIKKLKKVVSTNLVGLRRQVVEGLLHCFFNLHTTRTYRSSSDSINFQNLPVRDPWAMKLVRTAFIPRRGRQLVEVDYSGIEIRIAACYHEDPRMIEYICDPDKDMHRDMAMECYKLTAAELGDTKKKPGKTTRYCGKNMFVFPQFYGDWYIDCARSMWDAMGKLKLTTADGTPLKKHLASKGIRRVGRLEAGESPLPGTFEAHIQKVEHRFWTKRFPTYAQWKKDWYEAYRRQGYFQTLTGFICQGFMKRNEVINYAVQGSAFHCLLQSVIYLVRRELRRRKMRTKIVGQIHDSIVADSPANELHDFLGLCQEVMVKKIMKLWPWIIVPLEIEADVAPIDAPWSAKKPMEIPS